jgi:hypothetical protein
MPMLTFDKEMCLKIMFLINLLPGKIRKKHNLKIPFLVLVITGFIVLGVFESSGSTSCTLKGKQRANCDTITFKTFKTESGWGYNIYIREKLYIHQPIIPAISGNKGFAKKKHAERTAKVVVEKIIKHIIPPTVTMNELDSLGVSKKY